LDRGEAEEILKELGPQVMATGKPLENSERLALKDILNENQSSINGEF
jgi:hypothetical protein